jgi:dolichyl-phosphate beta-glucosyltransferase
MTNRFSLVLPALNEARRLPPYLVTIREYMDCAFVGDYEVIIVDDGSKDGMRDVLAARFADWPQLRVLSHPENLGKGAAVRTGVLASRGDLILFADADGATPIQQEQCLRTCIELGSDVAVGSRTLSQGSVTAQRRWHRRCLASLFSELTRILFTVPVRDTQCGFKMFQGDVGRQLFSESVVNGYLFDIDILIAARNRSYRVMEVPILWSEVPGSKIRPIRDCLRMFIGLLGLRMASFRRRSVKRMHKFPRPWNMNPPSRLLE